MRRSLQIFLGLVAGLLLTELLFWWRDDGAFPHLRLYTEDAALGVRLEPGASQRIAFSGNPATDVRINSDGYRGADLPPPAAGEILVVGDSQVFGLGVEEDQVFSARLAVALGGKTTVVNGGVPTYGPAEYTAVVREMLERRKPATVIYTVNMVNDLFEVGRPNAQRHAVWDGWAVRAESAPDSVIDFPGRRFLFSRSHAFFALRRWWYGRGPRIDDRGFSSEGTWKDVAGAGGAARARHAEAAARREHLLDERGADIRAAEERLAATEDTLDTATVKAFPDGTAQFTDPGLKFRAARANPGDILDAELDSEAARGVVVTAELIRQGTAYRNRLQESLRKRATARGASDLVEAFEARTALVGKLAQLDSMRVELPPVESPLAPVLREVKALCDARGARLIVLVLPIDVQVSPAEWKKYGAEPRDMGPTRILIDDIVAAAASIGASALDATAVLAAAEPGAFLDGDIHMTARGHQAVADAVAKVIATPPPPPANIAGPARSLVPIPAAWRAVDEVRVAGSTRAGCETKQIREWLRVTCAYSDGSDRAVPVDLTVVSGGRGEAMTLATRSATALVAPVLAGDPDLVVDFVWTTRTQRLTVSWPAGAAAPTMGFGPAIPNRTRPPYRPIPPTESAICDCWTTQYGGQGCSGAYGAADAACTAVYASDCRRMLECVRRDPASPAGRAR